MALAAALASSFYPGFTQGWTVIWHCKFKQTLLASNLLLVMGFIIVTETLTQTPSEISFLLYRPQGSSRLRGKREFQSSSCPFSAFKLEETTAQGMGQGKTGCQRS